MNVPDTSEDVDLTLRQVSRQFPEQFASALLPPGMQVSAASWLDTQVADRQRRLDRALDVVADGRRRWEHTEWQLRMTAQVPRRIFEYNTLLVMASDSLGSDSVAGSAVAVPAVRSTLVLLTGRERKWPAEGRYRTSPPDAPFSGVTFRIDAVYQRTVAELEARGSLLWLIFAPLAVDADAAAMVRVLARLREGASGRELSELVAAMLVMADTDGRRRSLRQVIVSLLKEESIMESWVYKQGEQTGLEKGLEKGLQPARKTLVLLYEARFGGMAPELRARVEAAHQPDLLDRWAEVVAHASKGDVDRALAEG